MLSIPEMRAVLTPIWHDALHAHDFGICAAAEAILRLVSRGSIAVGMGLSSMTAEELAAFARALAILGPGSTYDAEQLIKEIFTSPEPGEEESLVPAPGEVYLACEQGRVVLSQATVATAPANLIAASNSAELEPLACRIVIHLLGAVPAVGYYRCPPFLAQAAQFPPSAGASVPQNSPA